MAREYRFFIDKSNGFLSEDFTLSLQSEYKDIFHRLLNVLRVGVGDVVVFFNGKMGDDKFFEFVFSVEVAHKKEISFRFLERRKNVNEIEKPPVLVLALPNKLDKLDFILQKAVELGVGKVVLVSGDYSRLKHALKEDRMGKIVMEASEQAERGFVPEVVIEGKLLSFLEKIQGKNCLVLLERSDAVHFSKISNLDSSFLVVGPEGGFSDEEKLLFEELGVTAVSLGKRILRMETAVVVGLGFLSCY